MYQGRAGSLSRASRKWEASSFRDASLTRNPGYCPSANFQFASPRLGSKTRLLASVMRRIQKRLASYGEALCKSSVAGDWLVCRAENVGDLRRLRYVRGPRRVIRADGLHVRGIERLIFVSLVLVDRRAHLEHFAATFKDSTLLDDQRRCLNVAIYFRCPAQFKALRGYDVAVDGAVDHCH